MSMLRTLQVRLSSYWHAGGGRGAGHHLDALCERDDGLPVLPGRQLKGLLRDVVRRAEHWGWLESLALPSGPSRSHEQLLFGSVSQAEHRSATHPGVLRVSSARLPVDDRCCLAQADNASFVSALFGELFSTAINENGSALEHSLRGIEVAVPAMLEAELELAATALDESHRTQQDAYLDGDLPWRALDAAMPLLDHVGAWRSRGLGECVAELTAAPAQGAR